KLQAFSGGTTAVGPETVHQSSSVDHVATVDYVADGSDGRRRFAASEAAPARDRYSFTNLHAQGGIGQVWLARDAALGREVALKELKPDRLGDPSTKARFLNEARITGRL